jgi:Rod binding domain-containing protein
MIIGTNFGPTNTPDGLRRAAEAFEARTLASLYAQAFATVDPSKGRFGGGAAEAQWRPVLIEGIAEAHARGGGIGLADAVHREMLRAQEARAAEASGNAAGQRQGESR